MRYNGNILFQLHLSLILLYVYLLQFSVKRTDGKFELCFEADEVQKTEDETDGDVVCKF